MKIFSDSGCTKLVENLDLGIVAAGGSKLFEYYVQNDGQTYLRKLNFSLIHEEVEITSAPTSLNPGEVGKLILEWKPSVTIKEGLSVEIKVSGEELCYPKRLGS